MARSHFLITGIPYMVGSSILQGLLAENASEFFTVLVPKGIEDKAKPYVDSLRQEYQMSKGQLRMLVADISQPQLGLRDEDYELLRTTVTHVIHAECSQFFSGDKDYLYNLNVIGTENVTYFAKQASREYLKAYVYIGSAYVVGKRLGVIKESDFPTGDSFNNYYEQTMYAGEDAVRTDSRKVPTVIIRPTMVLGHSRTGEASFPTGIYSLFSLIRNIPFAPPILGGKEPLNLVPVDYLVAVVQAVIDKLDKAIGNTYHVADPQALPAQEVYDRLCRLIRGKNASLAIPPVLLRSLLSLPLAKGRLRAEPGILDYLYHGAEYDTSNTQDLLADSGVKLPRIDEYLPIIVDYYHKQLASS